MKTNKSKLGKLIAILGTLIMVISVIMISPVSADSDSWYDMTTDGAGAVEETMVNGALWKTLPITDPTGSGVFDAFFRVSKSPNERGYNTDGRPLQFDEKTSASFTHSYPLSQVYPFNYDGMGMVREFQLDINESSSTPYISLDEFQVWTTNDPNLLGYNESTGSFPTGTGMGQAMLVYDMDADGDTWIGMDYRWNTGSGKRDYAVLIPYELFNGKELDYVVIFTRHGAQGGEWTSDSGYEEWGIPIYPPKPDTAVTIITSDAIVRVGDTVDLTIAEANTGQAALSNVSVVINDGTSNIATLDETTAVKSIDEDNILDVMEVWTWTITVTVSGDTTFTATGSGWTPEEEQVTYPGYPLERSSVMVDTINPNTTVSIESSAEIVYPGETVDLTITEDNTGDDRLESPSVTVSPGGYTLVKGDAYWVGGDTNDNGKLNTSETWEWKITGVEITADTTFVAIGDGIDSLGGHVTYDKYPKERDTIDIDLIAPDTLVEISSSDYSITPSEKIDLTITETNTGDEPLTDPYIWVGRKDTATGDPIYPGWALGKADIEYTGGDTNSNGKLDPEETWTWVIEDVELDVDTTFTVKGHGLDSLLNDITYNNGYVNERDRIYVEVIVPHPDTLVDIRASAYTVSEGDTIDLTVTEKNTGDEALETPYVWVGWVDTETGERFTGWAMGKEDEHYVSGDTNDDGILDIGEIWTWVIEEIEIEDDVTFTAKGHGYSPGLEEDVAYPDYPDERDRIYIDFITHPDTRVCLCICPCPLLDYVIYPGDTLTLLVTETNMGDEALEDPYVYVIGRDPETGLALDLNGEEGTNGWVIGKDDPQYVDGDVNENDKLDPGETWTWVITGVEVSEDVTITAKGHGWSPEMEEDVTAPDYRNERVTVYVDVMEEES